MNAARPQSALVFLQRLIDLVCKGIDYLAGGALAMMVVLVFGNVVLRYGFDSGITVSEELARLLFVWATFLGAVVALRDNGHLGTGMLTDRLSARGRRWCLGITQVGMLYVSVLLLHGAWTQARINLGTTSAVLEIAMTWLYVPGILFAILSIAIVGLGFYRLLTGQVHDSDIAQVHESDKPPQSNARGQR